MYVPPTEEQDTIPFGYKGYRVTLKYYPALSVYRGTVHVDYNTLDFELKVFTNLFKVLDIVIGDWEDYQKDG